MQQDILYDKYFIKLFYIDRTQKPDFKQPSSQYSSQKTLPLQTLKKQLHEIISLNKSKQQQFMILQKQLLFLQKQQQQLQSLQLHKQLQHEQKKLQLLHYHKIKNHINHHEKQQKQQGKQQPEQQLEMNEWLNKVQQLNGLPQGMIDSLLSMQYEGNQQDNDICLACYKNMENGEMSKYLPCSHLFHSQCIDNHLKVSKVCPACMEEVVL